jgi:uncharacterized protein (DUF697 family)
MKLRKAIKLVAAGAAVTASASIMAAPTVGGFTTTGGVVNATCPAGYTCSTSPITDVGFMQRQITENTSGRTFIQTISSEGDTTGGGGFAGNTGFSDESFVEIGGGSGVIDQQKIGEKASSGGVTEDFNSTANISSGQFRVADVAAIDLTQNIHEVSSEDFTAGFNLTEMDNSAFGGNITAQVTLTSGIGAGDFTNTFKQQTLNVEDTTGTYTYGNYKKLDINQEVVGDLNQTVQLNERTGAAITEGGTTTAGSAGDFSAGDTLVQLQIGQDIVGGGQFGLHDFVNETSGVAIGIDSLATNALPFQTITYTSGGDPFAAF